MLGGRFFILFFIFFCGTGLFGMDVHAQTTGKSEAELQIEYDSIQKEIDRWNQILEDTRKKANTLQGDISGLTAKIKEAESIIKQKNVAISLLGKQISDKTKKIKDLEVKLDKGHQSLAHLLQKTNEIDSYTILDVVLANKDLSGLFQDINSFASIKKEMQDTFRVVREVKANTEVEKKELDKKKDAETDAKYAVETKKKGISQDEAEKKKLLSITKNEEKGYQTILEDRQRRAAQIRAALFKLRDTEGIPFSQALEYANIASEKTGVRPALILAILTQETDLGKNQGSCILSSLETGDGVGKNTGTPFSKIMKAPRDTEPFGKITARLGIDWKVTPVSCPASGGYGGGMGPSQFIPSTWELFKNRVGSALGIKGDEANPWNPEHSFTATGIYLADLIVTKGSYTSEKNAACKYYSGRSCDNKKPANTFYGTQVMKTAETIQANIDFLKGV